MSERLPKILAVDDDLLWLQQIEMMFEDEYEVTCCETIDQGLMTIANNYFDVVLLDLNFAGDTRTGLDVFRRIASTDNSIDVVVISGETRIDKIIQIMNAGPAKFITKPSSLKDIREAVSDLINKRELRFRALNLAQSVGANSDKPLLIGSSVAMGKLREEIAHAIESGAKDILLIGETGTGKEVVAKTIASKADPAKRMIPIHCGALSDGLAESELFGHVKGAFTGAIGDRASAFEAVSGGYVFLDEIGEMPINQQIKLLRVLQERKVQRVGSHEQKTANFRCISATNADIHKAIEEKRFREDLYYRIAKLEIKLPTLRERTEDIPELVHYFFSKIESDSRPTINDEAMVLLQSYEWPGNVRQLQSVIEGLASRSKNGTIIRERDVCQALPELGKRYETQTIRSFLGREGLALTLSEKKRFEKALIETRGDRSKAAKLLNISRATFYRRAKELGLAKFRNYLS